MQQIDRRKISPPQLRFSKRALKQVLLIAENDFTLRDKVFRVQITGKGCEGFTYSCGFTAVDQEDFIYPLGPGVKLHLDPFTAFYLQRGVIRYQKHPDTEEEGFIVINLDQEKFEGKFWKDDSSKEPPVLQL